MPVGHDRITVLLTGAATLVAGPLRSVRRAYLPLLMVYVASGATGVIAVAETFWLKSALTLSPADLATIAIWLQLPWAAKMIVGELIDTVPLAGSRRLTYLRLGAALMASGLATLALAGSGWLAHVMPATLYLIGQLLVVIGGVIQEVVADALSGEVVARDGINGRPRSADDVGRELAQIQVLARIAYSVGALVAASLSGVLAATFSYAEVCALALIIPLVSLIGGSLLRQSGVDRTLGVARRPNVRLIGGGLGLIASATLVGVADPPYAQEIIFAIAMATICNVAIRLLAPLPIAIQHQFIAIAIVAFLFRAAPTLGEGYRWFAIDRLGFDELFLGTLQVTGTALGLVLIWLLSARIDGRRAGAVFLLLTLIAALLWVPSVLLSHGIHTWTASHLGIGARGLALIDESVQTPLGLLATVPLMTMVAVHAPDQQRATWFAIAAALMSLAIVASQLLTKWINVVFVIERGDYTQVAPMVLTVLLASLVLPLTALLVVGRRLN